MKKILITSLACLLALVSVHSQQYKWAKIFDGQGDGGNANRVAIDANGNKYIAGQVNYNSSWGLSSVDADPGSGTNLMPDGRAFFAKYDVDGNLLWAKYMDEGILISHVKIDPTGNVLLFGYFGNQSLVTTLDFDPSSTGVSQLTAYGADMFIAKFTTTGAFTWVKQLETAENATADYGAIFTDYTFGMHPRPNTVAVDNAGNIMIAGSFAGIADFDLNSSFGIAFDAGTGSEFFVKYDNTGALVWLFFNGSSQNGNAVTGLTCDDAGNTFITGRYSEDPTVTGSINSIYYLKIGSDNLLAWLNEIPVSSYFAGSVASVEYPKEIRLDNSDNIYITGVFKNTVDFNPGVGVSNLTSSSTMGNGFLSKFNATGDFTWAKKMANNMSSGYVPFEIAANNRLVLAVDIPGPGDLDLGNNTLDTFGTILAIYDTAANLISYKALKYDKIPNDMRLHGEDIYMCGNYLDTMDFDILTPNGNFTQEGQGQSCYMAKYNQCKDNIASVAVTICQGSTYNFGTQSLSAAGTYTELFTTPNNCDSTAILTLSVINMDTSVTRSNNVLTATVNGAVYQWLNCSTNTAIAGATNKTFTATTSGSYKVIVTIGNCSDTSNCHTVTLTGIDQPEFAKAVRVFPNPASTLLNINYNPSLPIDNLVITDLTGRIIKSVSVKKDNSGKTTVGVNELVNGVYLIKLSSRGEQIVFKFVKQ
ncbi:MAG: T9SS type A sorting domain-containing protein [Taibaiella sp.]|jgi:hypothetical protein